MAVGRDLVIREGRAVSSILSFEEERAQSRWKTKASRWRWRPRDGRQGGAGCEPGLLHPAFPCGGVSCRGRAGQRDKQETLLDESSRKERAEGS